MPGVSRVNIDIAGGLIISSPQNTVFLEGKLIAVKGSQIQSHGSGSHSSATIIEGSTKFTIGSLGVCRQGNKASCLHTASGSSKMSCG